MSQSIFSTAEKLKAAEMKYNELKKKLAGIDAELTLMRRVHQNETIDFQQEVLSQARTFAELMISESKQSAKASLHDLQLQLTFELGAKMINRAEEILSLRLAKGDPTQLKKEFSNFTVQLARGVQ